MNTAPLSFAPVSLSYVAALRGYMPRKPGEAFAYAMANCTHPEILVALAASNPEGKFYGFVSDTDLCSRATRLAADRQVDNVWFLGLKISAIAKGEVTLPEFDYLVCDESQKILTNAERAAVFDIAASQLRPNGLFNYAYRAYGDAFEALRFLVREVSPDLTPEQASDFLLEIKKLGHLYLKTRPDLASKLDQAIARNVPDEFFALFDEGGETHSNTFNTVTAMRSHGMVYAGAGQIGSNYIELCIPAEAQPIIVNCQQNPLYEAIKDFAAMAAVRSDIWCRSTAVKSASPAQLFGGFTYGITLPEDKVPPSIDVFGKAVDVSAPVYRKLISLMTLQPAAIGDVLQDAEGKLFTPAEVVDAVQILVALGVARPMRGAREANNVSSVAQPRFAGNFNRYIDKLSVNGDELPMASPVMGDVVSVSSRDVLVMQALNRAGLANSVSALLPELERLAKNPASAAQITDTATPTEETAYKMINDVVSQSIVQWYAYGLLEAA